MTNYVWEFTNQRKLTKPEFIRYFEKKVFKTIRKFEMMPSDKIFRMEESNCVNSVVLKSILEQKFIVETSGKANIYDDNLSDVAEETFDNILKGNFSGPLPKDTIARPLYYHSDKEIKVYCDLLGIEGKKKERNEKIQELFNKFIDKNQDLEINVVKALMQLPV